MARVAFVAIGAVGHISPSLGVAYELARRGEDVCFFVPPWSVPLVAQTGARIASYQSTILQSGTPRRMNGFAMPHIPLHTARELVSATPQLLSSFRSWTPDVIVYDAFTFAGMLAARIMQIPAVRMNFSYVLSDENYFRGTETGCVRGSLTSPESLASFIDVTQDFFREYTLPELDFHELVSHKAEMDVVPMPKEFYPQPLRLRGNVRFVGATLCPVARPAVHPVESDRSRYQRLVVISLGSVFTFQPGFFFTCLEAFTDFDMQVVMAVGDIFPDGFWLDVPDNFVVQTHIPQYELLKRADLLITHGGMSSVMESLVLGVPMLVVPQFPEQWITARRVAKLGAGLHLEREDVSLDSLRKAVDEILSNPEYRQQARSLGAKSQAAGGYVRAADVIQQMVGGPNVTDRELK